MNGIEKLPSGSIKISIAGQELICSEHDAKRTLAGLWLSLMPYGTPAPKEIKEINMAPEQISTARTEAKQLIAVLNERIELAPKKSGAEKTNHRVE